MLCRVDDRLIHGQVVVAWGQRLRPARIWVVDDAAAADAWEREALAMSAPGIEVRVMTVAEAASGFAAESEAAGGAFLLVRGLQAALALVESGAAVTAYTIGGLHYAPGKTKVNEYVYLDDPDRRAARALLARGVQLLAQDVPGTRPQPLVELEPALGAV
jgi:mannose/fructose/N-acetylgalactosamine-specific phosphotransferase system component IIB